MQSTQTYLAIVADRGTRRLPLERVYHHLANPELLLRAYEKLYPNKGALTPGTEPRDKIDGMSLRRIDAIVDVLKAGKFYWTPSRRVYIPKANGKLRPLGIPNWTDKLVEQALQQILTVYYEPQFSDYSHGFRPGRGCHTALQQIKRLWTGTKWFIEGDIKGCFDNIDHEKLLAVIGRNIKDHRLLKLLRGMLAAGYLEKDWKYERTYSGTPQGGVLSPLLANIFLNELDTYVETVLMPKYTRGGRRKANSDYERTRNAQYRARLCGNKATYKALRKERRALPSYDPDDPDYRRLRYVRYADDFLIGFVGPRQEAEEVKQAIKGFLQTLGLTLSEEKTLITHAQTERARFLGYELFIGQTNTRLTKGRRSLNGRVQFAVPKDVVTKWIARYSKDGKPIHRAELTTHSDYDIVRTYAVQLRGLANYYVLAHDVSRRMQQVKHVMTRSLVCTLANKHRRHASQIYRKHRRILKNGLAAIVAEIPREGKAPLVAVYGGFPIRHRGMAVLEDNHRYTWNRRTEMATRLLAKTCELCGSHERVQVHHIRKLSDLRRRWAGRSKPPEWVQTMIAIRRKTLITCASCHNAIHHGTYDGRSLG